MAFCYGVIHICFSISECVGRGFDSFSVLVKKGELDRYLVRPQSMFLQVLGSKFEFTRIGRFAQSIFVLVYAIANLSIDWSWLSILTVLFMIIGGVFIFMGIFLLGATLCFWTIEGIELVNILTDGGREVAQYPLNIYPEGVRKFFTFVIPFGVINYLPLQYILGKIPEVTTQSTLLYTFMPLIGIVFLLPCLFIWYIGLKHYASTGS